MKAVAVGQKAPDFTMNDPEGNPVSLSFKNWFKTCCLLISGLHGAVPAAGRIRMLLKFIMSLIKKDLMFLEFPLTRQKDDWVKAIADDKLTWTHVSDLQYWNNAAAKLYAVNSIPANFLLDENGIIIGRNLRGDDLYNKVKEVLGEISIIRGI